jgi:hypothetical protein
MRVCVYVYLTHFSLKKKMDQHVAAMDEALKQEGDEVYVMKKIDQRFCRQTMDNITEDITLGRYCWWAQNQSIVSTKTKVGPKPFPAVQVGIEAMNLAFNACIQDYEENAKKLQTIFDQQKALQRALSPDNDGADAETDLGSMDLTADTEHDLGSDGVDPGGEEVVALPPKKNTRKQQETKSRQLVKIRRNQDKRQKQVEAQLERENQQRLSDIARTKRIKNVKASLRTRFLFKGESYQKFFARQKGMATARVRTLYKWNDFYMTEHCMRTFESHQH